MKTIDRQQCRKVAGTPTSVLGLALALTAAISSLSWVAPARAEIREAMVRSDAPSIVALDEFCFTRWGGLELNVSSISLSGAGSPDLSKLGFFLLTHDAWSRVLRQLQNLDITCALQSNHSHLIYTFDGLVQPPNHHGVAVARATSFFHSLNLTDDRGQFTLLFANCLPQIRVSMVVRSAMFNIPDPANPTRRAYLSDGVAALPLIYSLLFFAYATLTAAWAAVLFRRRRTAYRIHYFMLAVVVLTALNVLCEAEDKSRIGLTGSAHGWDVLFYISRFLNGVSLFALLVLIGSGWSFLRPYLQHREKKALLAVIPLQVIANTAQVAIDESGPFARDSVTWKQVLLIVDIVCCCAVLFPIFWSIKKLREEARSDGKAAVNLRSLTLFRRYYICYIYFTRAAVYALASITTYHYLWSSVVAGEVATLAFYAFTGYKIWPESHKSYFAIDDEEEEAVEEAIKLHGESEM